MKKRLVVILLMVFVLMMAACGNSNSAEEPTEADNQMTGNETDTDISSSLDGVTMEVTEYSDTSVTVRITNDTDMNIRCGGEDFCLKILDGETGEWRDLDTVIDDYAFFEEAYMIQKDSPYEMVIDFEWLYGKLEPGRYQIVKTVTDFRGTGDYTNYVYAAAFDISMEEAEYPDAGASMTSQKDISVASFWDRERRFTVCRRCSSDC